MDRIFTTSTIEEIVNKDKSIIKSVNEIIEDIQKVAGEASNHAADIPAEAKSGDVSGNDSNVKSSIDKEALSE